MSEAKEPNQVETCSCLTEIPRDLMKNLNKTKEYKGTITKISFKDLSWTTVDWQVFMRLVTNLEFEMTTRKTPKKVPLFFNYCPFCGVEYK